MNQKDLALSISKKSRELNSVPYGGVPVNFEHAYRLLDRGFTEEEILKLDYYEAEAKIKNQPLVVDELEPKTYAFCIHTQKQKYELYRLGYKGSLSGMSKSRADELIKELKMDKREELEIMNEEFDKRHPDSKSQVNNVMADAIQDAVVELADDKSVNYKWKVGDFCIYDFQLSQVTQLNDKGEPWGVRNLDTLVTLTNPRYCFPLDLDLLKEAQSIYSFLKRIDEIIPLTVLNYDGFNSKFNELLINFSEALTPNEVRFVSERINALMYDIEKVVVDLSNKEIRGIKVLKK